MESVTHPINKPFVLEFVLSWLPANEIAKNRLVSKRWNGAYSKSIVHQLQGVEAIIKEREEELEQTPLKEIEMIKKLEEEPPATLKKSKEKGHLFQSISEIGKLPRPYQVYEDVAEVLNIFLGRPDQKSWEKRRKVYLQKEIYEQLKEVHTKQRLNRHKIAKIRGLISKNWRLSVPFIRAYNSFRLANIFEYVIQTIEAYEKRESTLKEGGIAAQVLRLKEKKLYKERLEMRLKT